MNRRVLGSGAVVCSALAIYGWIQPSLQPDVEDCGDDSANVVSTNATSTNALKPLPSQSSALPEQQKHCSHGGIIPIIENALELLPGSIQWGRNHSVQIPGSMEKVYSDVLKQAQTDAERDRLIEAVTAVTGIPQNSRYYEIAQHYQEDWSQELLQRATDQYQQADIDMALTLLNAIPLTSQHYARVQELQKHWSEDQKFLNQAIAANNREDWQGVIESLNALKDTSLYHSLRVQELLQHAINNLFKPDDTFMQMVSSPPPSMGSPASVTRMPTLSSTNPDSTFMEPVPESSIGIDLNQALEWAQPSTSTVSTSTAPSSLSQPSGILNPVSNNASTIDLTLTKPSEFASESNATQPSHKPLSGNLAGKP